MNNEELIYEFDKAKISNLGNNFFKISKSYCFLSPLYDEDLSDIKIYQQSNGLIRIQAKKRVWEYNKYPLSLEEARLKGYLIREQDKKSYKKFILFGKNKEHIKSGWHPTKYYESYSLIIKSGALKITEKK